MFFLTETQDNPATVGRTSSARPAVEPPWCRMDAYRYRRLHSTASVFRKIWVRGARSTPTPSHPSCTSPCQRRRESCPADAPNCTPMLDDAPAEGAYQGLAGGRFAVYRKVPPRWWTASGDGDPATPASPTDWRIAPRSATCTCPPHPVPQASRVWKEGSDCATQLVRQPAFRRVA
jgi:hypothetical protein